MLWPEQTVPHAVNARRRIFGGARHAGRYGTRPPLAARVLLVLHARVESIPARTRTGTKDKELQPHQRHED